MIYTSALYDNREYPLCSLIPDFFGFLAWRAKKDEFKITIQEDSEKPFYFTVRITPDLSGRGWWAIAPEYYDGENKEKYTGHSVNSPAEALEELIERLKENI